MGHLFLVKNLLGRGEETVAWRSSRDASLPSTREFGETATGVGRSIPGVRRHPRSRSLSSPAAVLATVEPLGEEARSILGRRCADLRVGSNHKN